MAVAYLMVNAVMYIGLGAWCTLLPDKTSAAIGFGLASPSGRSEYLTVYGGLEIGLGVFFLIAALDPPLRPAAILLALVTYGCLAVFRLGTLLTLDGVGRFPVAMFAIELPMALIAAYLWFGSRTS